jgi:hypothetical protein
VVFGAPDDDVVDKNARNFHVFGMQRVSRGEILGLRDNDPVAVVCSLGERKLLEQERLVIQRHVSVLIGGRASDERDVDRKSLVEEILLAFAFHNLDVVLGRDGVHPSAFDARGDEGA